MPTTGNIRMAYGDTLILEAKLANPDGTFAPAVEPIVWSTTDPGIIGISEVSPNGARIKVTALARFFTDSATATVSYVDADSNAASYQFTVYAVDSMVPLGEINIVPPVPISLPSSVEIDAHES